MSINTIYVSKIIDNRDNFENMIHNPIFENTLFIFNDNHKEHNLHKKGAGNAVIRKYNKHSGLEKPRSAGIPTGYYRSGFTDLSSEVKQIIDSSIEEIKQLVKTYNYTSLVYSVDNYDDYILGTGLFEVHKDVLQYITNNILSFSKNKKIVQIVSGQIVNK